MFIAPIVTTEVMTHNKKAARALIERRCRTRVSSPT
jgi:hypothetical protein